MFGQINQKILGSFLVGIALVSGAIIYSRFGIAQLSQPASVNGASAAARTAIAITDKDENGVEDWRDTFFTTEAIIDDSASSTYEAPTTVTGQLGIQFLESMIRSKYYGSLGQTKEEVVDTTVNKLNKATEQKLFDTHDVVVMSRWTDSDIRNYANAMADAILTNNVEGVGNELEIMNDAINNGKTERLKELKPVADIYANTLEDSLKIPVPSPFLKQHLDLLNSYRAIQEDISAMSLAVSDPMVSLVRFKRYQDDVTGLTLSLQNMYTGLIQYDRIFTASDSAVFFGRFGPANNQAQ
jgi:hypothetical protein